MTSQIVTQQAHQTMNGNKGKDTEQYQKLKESFESLLESGKGAKELAINMNEIKLFIEAIAKGLHPNSYTFIIGSSGSGLYNKNSDLDITIITEEKFMSMKDSIHRDPYSSFHESVLNNIAKKLNLTTTVVKARVPVLKFIYSKFGTNCDLSINNIHGVRNTILTRILNDKDVRFRQLLFIVKSWAQSNKIYGGVERMFNGYAWTLLVLNFLFNVNPPVLPNLFQKYPKYFCMDVSINNFHKYRSSDFVSEWKSENTSSLTSLFFEFVKSNLKILSSKSPVYKINPLQSNISLSEDDKKSSEIIHIEEPFLFYNVARNVDSANLKEIIFVFTETLKNMTSKSDQSFRDLIFVKS